MWEDPIVAEVRRVRAAHAAQFENDLLVIFRRSRGQVQKAPCQVLPGHGVSPRCKRPRSRPSP